MLALRTTDLDALTEDSRARLLWLEHARLVETQRLAFTGLAEFTDAGRAQLDAELFPPDRDPEAAP